MTPSALLLAAFSTGQAPAIPQQMPAPNATVTPVQATAPAPLPAAMPAPNGAVLGPTAAPITPGFSPAQVSPGAATGIAPELERSITSGQADEPAEEEEKFLIMRALEGTSLGTLMAERRLSVSGWSQFSYTWSTTDVSNSPVVWNDRADKLMMNQTWLRLDKAVDTEADHATFGYRFDFLAGTDYRFTRQVGLFPDQTDLYGVDLPSFYVNAYLPNVFKGTDVRFGRLFTPFGVESLEAVSTPFVTRSYAFNWSPPFTHNGLQISPQFTDKLSGKFMIANGNDIWYVDGQEVRFVGTLSYAVSEDTAVTFGTSLGRGRFNPNGFRDLGVNNINVFDFVLTHNFSDKLSYAFEYIYGYQDNAPLPTAGGAPGTAHWYSFVNYLYYSHTDNLKSVARLEFFEDEEGARTGFNGLYTAITYGLQWTPCPDLIVRPQIRYDYNNTSTPWEGKDDIWTGAIEWIIRY